MRKLAGDRTYKQACVLRRGLGLSKTATLWGLASAAGKRKDLHAPDYSSPAALGLASMQSIMTKQPSAKPTPNAAELEELASMQKQTIMPKAPAAKPAPIAAALGLASMQSIMAKEQTTKEQATAEIPTPHDYSAAEKERSNSRTRNYYKLIISVSK